MTIEAVVFDIGNVLIEWAPEKYYDRVYGPDHRRRLFSEVDLFAMNLLVDQGHDFHDTIRDWAEAHPAYRREILDWHDRWLELATPAIPHSVRLLRALKRNGVPVFALSNFGAGSFDLARRHYDFLDEFDQSYVSGRMRLMKPDSAFYAALEAGSRVAPGALLFADDRPENIAAAEARGWQVHLFTTPAPFAARLVAEGLLAEGEAA